MTASNATATPAPGAEPHKPPKAWGKPGFRGMQGTAEQLSRAGVPAHWLADLPRPGKVRGEKRLIDGTKRVFVSVGERKVFRVQVEDVAQQLDTPALTDRRGAAFAAFMQRALL